MRTLNPGKVLLAAFVIIGLIAGCGREQTPIPPGNVPTVVSTNPLNGATVVPINQKIAAAFNQAMNPGTVMAPEHLRLWLRA